MFRPSALPFAVAAMLVTLLALAIAGCADHSAAPKAPAHDVVIGQVNGTVSLDGRPFGGQTFLRLDRDEEVPQTTRSLEDGRFFFPAVPAGSWQLRIEPPAGYRVSPDGEPSLHVGVTGGQASTVDVQLVEDTGDTTGEGREPLRVHVASEGRAINGVAVQATSAGATHRVEAWTDLSGDAYFNLIPDTYAVTADRIAGEMPWYVVESIQPSEVTLVEGQTDTSVVIVTLGRDPRFPLPKGELMIWVGVDSVLTNPPEIPDLPSIVFDVFYAGTNELVATGETGSDNWAEFQLDGARYDLAMHVPEGFVLRLESENPVRNLIVEPARQSWVGFMLVKTP